MELHPEHLGQLVLYFTRNFYSSVLVHLAANDKQNCYFKSLARDSMCYTSITREVTLGNLQNHTAGAMLLRTVTQCFTSRENSTYLKYGTNMRHRKMSPNDSRERRACP